MIQISNIRRKEKTSIQSIRRAINTYYIAPPEPTPVGDRGIFAGGDTTGTTKTNTIDYITISVAGNTATDFGDLLAVNSYPAGCSNGYSGRGMICGGTTAGSITDNTSYITITTPGTAVWGGDLVQRRYQLSSTDNGTLDRGLVFGGWLSAAENDIDYFTISTGAAAATFGYLQDAMRLTRACSNDINNKAIIAGGKNQAGTKTDRISYVTITSASNAIDFDDLVAAGERTSATSNGTNNAAVFMGGVLDGGYAYSTIQSMSILSGGCADTGYEMTTTNVNGPGLSNKTNDRAICGGVGQTVLTIDYLTISSLSNALDFGDLTQSRGYPAGFSNG